MSSSPEREPDKSAWRKGIGMAIFALGIGGGIIFKEPCLFPATVLLEVVYWASVLGEEQKEEKNQNPPSEEEA